MAGYGYHHRTSAAYTSPQTDDWTKPSYASEHVHRPVIVDAEGRKRPIIAYSPNHDSEYYVTRTTETVVREQVVPYDSNIKQTSAWSPRRPNVVEEKWQRHPSPVNDSAKVAEFFTNVQNEASKPKFGPMRASDWRQTAKPVGYSSEYNDYPNNDWKKPTNNGYHHDIHNDNYGKYGNNYHDDNYTKHDNNNKPSSTTHFTPPTNINTAPTYYKESSSPAPVKAPHYAHVDPVLVDTFESPKIATNGGWARPTANRWASPPNSNLSKPTSDIPEAIGVLKEAAKLIEPKYADTIDNVEAVARRYGNFGKLKISQKPYAGENNYTNIDSREAARKYQGALV